MAKSVKKKSAKEASNVFHNIMAASVKGNPKPKKEIDLSKPNAILNHIQEEVAMVVPDWGEYSFMQISMQQPYSIVYNIDENCPVDKHNKIRATILEQSELIGISAELDD
jgi:hypothetical protein